MFSNATYPVWAYSGSKLFDILMVSLLALVNVVVVVVVVVNKNTTYIIFLNKRPKMATQSLP